MIETRYILSLHLKTGKMAKKENKFWMCFVVGGKSPTFKHYNVLSAEVEAKRLCQVTGKKVYVLSVDYAIAPPDQFKRIEINEEKDDLPF